MSVLALLHHMVGWHGDRFLDPEVWERYLRHALAPVPIEQHLEKLQIGEMVNKMNGFSLVFEIYDDIFPTRLHRSVSVHEELG